MSAKLPFHFLLPLVAAIIKPGQANGPDDSSITTHSSYEFVNPKYNKQLRPSEGGKTDVVEIGMFVNSVRTISENDMTVILDVFLQAQWTDRRLDWTWDTFYRDHIRHNMPPKCMNESCYLKEMTLGKDFAAAIWRPDFYLPDAINIIPADDYNDNVCVRLSPELNLFYSNRLIITISCIMKLVYFPFDKHICPICIGSYKYHDGLVQMRWSNDLSGMYPDQFTANFFMEGYRGEQDYYNITMPYLADNFTEHCFDIILHRKYNIFLVTLYLPSVSLVALSWVNFWIDYKAIPARAGLSITAILAQITLIVGMASRFPSVSDLKMADLYLTVNFIYTFATLIEFAIVSYNPEDKRPKQVSTSKVSHVSSIPVVSNPTVLSNTGPGVNKNGSGERLRNHQQVFKLAPMQSSSTNSVSSRADGKRVYSSLQAETEDILQNGSVLGAANLLRDPASFDEQSFRNSSCKSANDARNRLSLNEPMVQLKPRPPPNELRDFLDIRTNSLKSSKKAQKAARRAERPPNNTNLDDVSKFIFPITFIIWNFIFFSTNLILAEKSCILLKYFAEDYCLSTCPKC
ncbi:gamma-aminobutyric acid receptor subunit delta-like [Symsagittifera roscoffensis]|uniref:gamma-aminobutyric acid receptor subunit delta-like n=1 Tax=Symsagittifera roscoffensis TaxID=84072 RepID=UPI00307B65C5